MDADITCGRPTGDGTEGQLTPASTGATELLTASRTDASDLEFRRFRSFFEECEVAAAAAAAAAGGAAFGGTRGTRTGGESEEREISSNSARTPGRVSIVK